MGSSSKISSSSLHDPLGSFKTSVGFLPIVFQNLNIIPFEKDFVITPPQAVLSQSKNNAGCSFTPAGKVQMEVSTCLMVGMRFDIKVVETGMV